ncbi:MAG: hypothetical protein FWE16_04600 [Firmicutes bacterium]|nr:hypothetical protein [Bacillota bacterium]
MKILYIDTTQRTMKIELITDKGNHIFTNNLDNKKHDAIVAFETKKLLLAANISFADLDAYAIGTGGTSWTGNRVGMTATKAFHMVYPHPIIMAISTEDAIQKFKTKTFADPITLEPIYDSEFVVSKKS